VTIFYPDGASYQEGIDLRNWMAFCGKATEGTYYRDPAWSNFKSEAAKVSAFYFGYHFLIHSGAAQQADYYYAYAGKTPCMVDFEPTANGAVRNALPGVDLTENLNRLVRVSAHVPEHVVSNPTIADACAFVDELRARGGVVHLVYLPRWYWQQMGSPSLQPLIQRGLLLVSSEYGVPYTDVDNAYGWASYGGMSPTIWQYSSTLAVGGLQNVDVNAFRGHYADKQDLVSVASCGKELAALVSTGKYPATPVPTPSSVWTHYGPVTNLTVRGGYTSIVVNCGPPTSLPKAPKLPDKYLVYAYEGAHPVAADIVNGYPRTVTKMPSGVLGGLKEDTIYTIRVVASDTAQDHFNYESYVAKLVRTSHPAA
jgi:hypothetical protein